ncbi:hypothetical protein N7489_001481 [Penicillium chrysogenum]|uniref:Uncharacterized protein n=1 Tax=Penicillium chrysogenum TaxID=5076 RepID=A0ABQ8WJJ8_PENCH|nr:uncharacterized protein N7489_001481 [Penicillium chrysogenum]KAJ5251071.1 hypothetical protein N7489_001481 [Penicillium chrysogenum]KAJ5262508.1 hypothetical protein N7524_007813 [Penicillium chrysogenum]KAJ5269971.1 hypothetical protein N7505_005729 [Penicillium chrysogenum]KAJ6147295.1 hypothetical protein N7497_009277 [Penicillium chrysogenum]
MAPNQRIVPSGSRPQKGFVSTLYDEATNPENKTIVRSLVVFGVRRYRVPPLQLRRVPPSSYVKSSRLLYLRRYNSETPLLNLWKHIGVGQRKAYDAWTSFAR